MTSLAYFDNAIAYAQLRLRGGWWNLLATTAAYAALVGAAMYVTATVMTSPTPTIIPSLDSLGTAAASVVRKSSLICNYFSQPAAGPDVCRTAGSSRSARARHRRPARP